MVIATKGRVQLLENLVVSIDRARSLYKGPTELLIVDDSSEEEAAQIREMCEKHEARYLFLTPSVSAKRNLGAKEAKYPIVLFLDSDCIVTEDILNEHARCYAESDKTGAVCGLLEFTGEGGKFWDAVSKSQFVVCFDMAKWGRTVPWGTTANFSVRKDVFEKTEGFDESFPNKPGGEDVDFGLRIGKAGYEIAANPKALVYHDKSTWTDVKGMYRRCWFYGNADTYIMDKHPERVIGQMPRRTLLYVFALLFGVLLSFIVSPWCLLGFPLWVVCDVLFTSLIVNRFAPYSKAAFREQVVIQSLIITNEAGFIKSCVMRGRPGFMFRQIAYFENQIKGISFNSSLLTLSLMINVSLFLTFVMLVSAYLV